MAADGSAELAEYDRIRRTNADLNYGSAPGTLASSTGCVAAIGLGATLSAAHPDGRLDFYSPSLSATPAPALSHCPVTVVSGSNADGGAAVEGDDSRADAARFDRLVAAVNRLRPPGSVLIVIGVADAGQVPHLVPLIVDGPGFARGTLISPSTQRAGYTQLIDIAPTVFELLGVGSPSSAVGQPVHVAGRHSSDTQAVVHSLIDANAAAQAQRPWVPFFYVAMVVLHIALLAVAVYFFYRRRQSVMQAQAQALPAACNDRPVGEHVADKRRFEPVMERASLTVACLPVATFLAALLPWWRAPLAFGTHLASIAAIMALVAVAAHRGPWRRWPLGPAAFVASFTAFVLAADVMTGSAMQLNSLAGYSPLDAGRFIGFGNVSFGIFAAAVLLSAAYLGQRLTGWRRVVLLSGMGVAAVLVVGTPGWGSDVGGVIALTPAVIALTLRGAGVRLSAIRVVGCGVAGVLAVAGFAALDYSRSPADRTYLGRFVQQLFDGTADVVIRRKAEANVNLLFTSHLTLLVLAVAAFVILVAWRRGAGLRRLLGIYPCLRAGLVALLFAATFGLAVNDFGIAIPAFMAVLAAPLVIATSLRALRT